MPKIRDGGQEFKTNEESFDLRSIIYIFRLDSLVQDDKKCLPSGSYSLLKMTTGLSSHPAEAQ